MVCCLVIVSYHLVIAMSRLCSFLIFVLFCFFSSRRLLFDLSGDSLFLSLSPVRGLDLLVLLMDVDSYNSIRPAPFANMHAP
jgi:hypothetical protein